MLKRFLLYILILLFPVVGFSLQRLYFLARYSEVFSADPAAEILLSLLTGVRYDLATAAIIAVPFVLLIFIPLGRRRRDVRPVLYGLLVWYLAVFTYNFIDIQYYAFAGRHLTREFEYAWRDAVPVLLSGGISRPAEAAGLILFLLCCASVFVIWVRRRYQPVQSVNPSPTWRTVFMDAGAFLVICTSTVVFLRGGLQPKPLSVSDAFSHGRMELAALSLNGVYTSLTAFFNHTLLGNTRLSGEAGNPLSAAERKDVLRYIISAGKESAPEGYPLYRHYGYDHAEGRPLNVVIFIMESWSAKYMGSLGGGVSATPFFDRLSESGLLMTNFFANGQRSFEGILAILGSVPPGDGGKLWIEDMVFQTGLEPLASVMSRRGYETVFIHGAAAHSMRFNRMARRLGFSRHIFKEDFPSDPAILDGVWGVYDEYIFKRAHEEFTRMSRPFLGVVYSLTSHVPYRVPGPEFKYFDASQPFHDYLDTVRYSDEALKRFFDLASGSSYFSNTLFVIVSDHTEGRATHDNLNEVYRIPCLFYAPGIVSPGRNPVLATQVDLVPTILDILRVGDPYTAWGKTVFDPSERRGLIAMGDLYIWAAGSHFLVSTGVSPKGLYDYTAGARQVVMQGPDGRITPLADRMQTEMLNYLRFSSDLLSSNRVMPVQAAGRTRTGK